jgi:hypothetical protein
LLCRHAALEAHDGRHGGAAQKLWVSRLLRVGRGVGIEEEASELRLFRQAASETNVKAGLPPNLALLFRIPSSPTATDGGTDARWWR